MRNPAENIFKYMERQSFATAPDVGTLERLPANLQIKHKDMKKIEILGKTYYTLPTGKDMGKSEKILLISEEKFNSAIINQTNLKPDALLKLPKNGVTTQVQSEGMALGISAQALDLTTANAFMICFNGKPALVVPFDDMEPLTLFAAGDVAIIRDEDRTDYEDSSINPLGPGLAANEFVNDFGGAFGLMYLTGDPDGIGGFNQNKGLQDRDLYIFDHAIFGHDSIFTSNYFQIDSRLRQTPKTLHSFSRHTKGRNFSLLEDASIEEKFESLSPEKCDRTLKYINDVITGMEERTKDAPEHLKTQHLSLIASAENARTLIEERIDTYNKMLPQAINNPDRDTLKHALVLENILNHPRMYSLTGRPYLSLLAKQEHSLKVTSVEAIADSDEVKIKFNKNLDRDTFQLIFRHLGDENIKYDKETKSMQINKHLLINLEEIFYPEKDTQLHKEVNYLDSIDTLNLSKSYHPDSDYCIRVIEHYKTKQQLAINDETRIINIEKARRRLTDPIETASSDKGFNVHMLKRFEFEAQKKLQEIISKSISSDRAEKDAMLDSQNQAFSAAVKLDCIQEFNDVCIHAAKNIHNPEMQEEIKLLFTKYKLLDLSNCTIRDAQHIRSEMLQDINRVLSLNPKLEERKQTQASFKSAAANVRSASQNLDEEVDAQKTSENKSTLN